MTETKKKIDPLTLGETLLAAQELFDKDPDWVTFFREVLGLGGIVRRTFATPDQMAEFEHSDACREIQRMLTRLRARPVVRPEAKKKTENAELEDVTPETGMQEPAEGQELQEEANEPKPEETKVITVRLPLSLLEALQEEAHEHRTSVNKLCISKLLQFIDHDFVPARKGGLKEIG
jgi:predicted HicB family RNase H-like nuclease